MTQQMSIQGDQALWSEKEQRGKQDITLSLSWNDPKKYCFLKRRHLDKNQINKQIDKFET